MASSSSKAEWARALQGNQGVGPNSGGPTTRTAIEELENRAYRNTHYNPTEDTGRHRQQQQRHASFTPGIVWIANDDEEEEEDEAGANTTTAPHMEPPPEQSMAQPFVGTEVDAINEAILRSTIEELERQEQTQQEQPQQEMITADVTVVHPSSQQQAHQRSTSRGGGGTGRTATTNGADTATTTNDDIDNKTWFRLVGIAVFITMVAIVLIIVFVFAISRTRNDEVILPSTTTTRPPKPPTTPKNAPSSPSSVDNIEDLMIGFETIILPRYSDIVTVPIVPNTPQWYALQWLKKDDITIELVDDFQSLQSRRLLQRYAMATIYFAITNQTKVPFTTNEDGYNGYWLANTNECYWYQTNIGTNTYHCNEYNELLHLELNQMGGSGSGGSNTNDDSPSLGNQNNTNNNDNNNNNNQDGVALIGTIPPEIGLLQYLERISFGDNSLIGTIPSQMGVLTRLEYVQLQKNQLSGIIPTEMGQLTRLQYFNVRSNNMIGTIPSQLGQLIQLSALYLRHNDFTGIVPTEICQLLQQENDGTTSTTTKGSLEWFYITCRESLQCDCCSC